LTRVSDKLPDWRFPAFQECALVDQPSVKDPLAAPTVPARGLVLAAAMMAIVLTATEGSIVATAMPTIVADLGGFHLFSWAFAVFLLTQAVSIPIYGRLADLYGRKPVFFGGTSLFLVASLLCGFAPGMVPFIIFRALQGAGAGAIQPIATTIVGDIYTPAERARVQGYLSGVFGIAAIFGPPLGAFLVERLSWSFVFWINLPIGAATFLMLGWFLPERREAQPHQTDYAGSTLLILGAGTLMLVLIEAKSLGVTTIVALVACGTLALIALAINEKRSAEPIFPAALWRNRVIALGNLGGFTNGAVNMAIIGYLPTYVQGAMGGSVLSAGLVLGASSISWAFASFAAGRLMVRTTYRLVAVIGGLSLVAGSLVLAMLEPGSGLAWAATGSFVIGVGMGFCNTAFVVSIQASVSWTERGVATSSYMFMRIVGQSVGAAVFGAILNFGLFRHAPEAHDLVNRVLDPGLRHSLGGVEFEQLSQAIASSLHLVYIISGFAALTTLALASALPAALSPTRQRYAGGTHAAPRGEDNTKGT
jgi:EmrB/QacA subfamily drug resistance transporter